MGYEADALRGKQAQQVIENETYSGAYTQVEDAITALWKASKDKDDREQLHMMLGLLGKVRGVFESAMRSGEVAEKELLRKRPLKERLTQR